MIFPFSLAVRNIKRKPFRFMFMSLLVMFLSFTLFFGAFTIVSMQRGLEGYRARLGADIVVVPNSAKGHGSLDDILLQGITGTYYMSGKDVDKIINTDGVQAVSRQFFLTSAKASCCSSRVQIIGFEPETDFSVQPWISESYSEKIGDGDVVIGANVSLPDDKLLKFYGKTYYVAAQLGQTGTGLDSAVFANMNTVRQMAQDASSLLDSDPFKGVDISSAASAVLIKTEEGCNISDVTDDINIHITKVSASSARAMISDISEGLSGVSKVIGALVAVIWLLAVVILLVVFALLSNERRKEFAVLRIMGASSRMIFTVLLCESIMVSVLGAVVGLLCSFALSFSLSDTLKSMLGLPFLLPDAGMVAVLSFASLVLAVSAGIVTSFFSARKITGSETALLLREDT